MKYCYIRFQKNCISYAILLNILLFYQFSTFFSIHIKPIFSEHQPMGASKPREIARFFGPPVTKWWPPPWCTGPMRAGRSFLPRCLDMLVYDVGLYVLSMFIDVYCMLYYVTIKCSLYVYCMFIIWVKCQ